MMLALLWLTISIPFVYNAQQKQAAIALNYSSDNSQNDNSNPFSNTTEEKAPVQVSEEYLHTEQEHHYTWITIRHYNNHRVDIYTAFHGELISPPPEA